jgi:hypothetical protein
MVKPAVHLQTLRSSTREQRSCMPLRPCPKSMSATRKTRSIGKNRPTTRKRAAVCRPVVAEHELDRLVDALRAACGQHGGARTVLQIDFMRGQSGPGCVLRIAEGARTWLKMGEGPWGEVYLQALVDRRLVAVVERFRLGATLRPLPRLLAKQEAVQAR